MVNRVVFYLPKDSLFEATVYYCNLIKNAVKNIKGVTEVLYVTSIDEIRQEDVVVTIRINDPFAVSGRCKKVIHWFQGIAPEERIMMGNGTVFSRLAAAKYYIMEFLLLRKPFFFFFVSQAMKDHYTKKYRVDLKGCCTVVPCYNIPLDKNAFNVKNKYNNPSFVYAGGMSNWQCVKESLQIYMAFKKNHSAATFTILTKDKDKAEALVKDVGGEDVLVKFVPLESLQEELSRYKYGFLLREHHIINKVSTPTKMNSYLSAGVIPIYTTAVADFDGNIDLGDYAIKFNSLNIDEIVIKLSRFESKSVDCAHVFQTFKKIFENYYNDLKHIEAIGEKLKCYLAE